MNLQTRLPFRYGIAEMTTVPHLFVGLDARFDGAPGRGIAADHLPPRWFRKDPAQSPQSEIAEMLRVIRKACQHAIGQTADNPFQWWRTAYQDQMAWASIEGIPPLLAHFGVTLVERALIDAACRAAERPFHAALLSGKMGFEPAEVHAELLGFGWRQALPENPLERITVRHTVGLDDPLESSDGSYKHLDDGLPESLVEVIRAYGIRHFKIKLRGDPDEDQERLERLERILQQHCGNDFAFSLDINEAYPSISDFKDSWQSLRSRSPLLRMPKHLLFVEQPVHRDGALQPGPNRIDGLPGAPLVIIDEADAEIRSLPDALDLGYAGTSHKNCKGVFKGLANRCLLAKRHSEDAVRPLIMSGEDLANIGPVALLQDLAVQATLGIESVERNGHHYFRGLSAFPSSINDAVLSAHPDLFTRHPDGWPTLDIRAGSLWLRSLSTAGLGPAFACHPDFTPQVLLHDD